MRTVFTLATFAASSLALTSIAHAETYERELAQLEARFKSADANGDGKLTKDEAKAGNMDRLARFFGRVDSDGDGFVTLAQLKARLAERHDK